MSLGKGIHQGGYPVADFLHQINEYGGGLNGAVNHPVEHVFHGPAQLTHGTGTDHSAGAFQGMEGAPEFHQGLFIAGVGGPAGKILVQGFQHFAHFFLENLDDFIIDQIVIVFIRQVFGGLRCFWLRAVRVQVCGRQAGNLESRVVLVIRGVPGHFGGIVEGRLQGNVRLRIVLGVVVAVADLASGIAVDLHVGVQLDAFHFHRVIAEAAALIQGITERVHTGAGQLQDIVGGFRIVAETFQVVLHRGDGIRQSVHAAPVRLGLVRIKQFFLNELHALAQYQRRLVELDHFQSAAHGTESLRYRVKMFRVPLGRNEFDDTVLGLFQAGSAFAQYRFHGLAHVAGHVVLITVIGFAAAVAAADTGQGRFHIKQGAGDIHQGFAFRRAFTGNNVLYRVELFFHQGAWLAQAQYGHGVGHLFQGHGLWMQFAGIAFAVMDEGFQCVLDGGDLFGKRLHHGIHGFGIRAGHAGPFRVDQVIGGQGIVKTETGFHVADARAVRVRLGHVVQQVLEQFRGRRTVQAGRAFADQFTQVAVHVAQHQFYRGAQDNGVFGEPFHQGIADAPQGSARGVAGDLLQLGEDLGHVAQVLAHIVVAQHTEQGDLEHLADFLGQLDKARVVEQVFGDLAAAGGIGEIRFEQGGFRQQRFATGGSQIIEQGQEYHRQVAPVAGYSIEIRRQLQDGPHQGFLAISHVADPGFQQRLSQLFHFFGEQSSTVELHHLQGAVHLVQMGLAKTHAGGVVRGIHERFQCLLRLVQGFLDLPANPVQSQIVVTVTHDVSCHTQTCRHCGQVFLLSTALIDSAEKPAYRRNVCVPDPDAASRSLPRDRVPECHRGPAVPPAG